MNKIVHFTCMHKHLLLFQHYRGHSICIKSLCALARKYVCNLLVYIHPKKKNTTDLFLFQLWPFLFIIRKIFTVPFSNPRLTTFSRKPSVGTKQAKMMRWEYFPSFLLFILELSTTIKKKFSRVVIAPN